MIFDSKLRHEEVARGVLLKLTLAVLWALVSPLVNGAENLRYLFLVQHSTEMATRQVETVQTIYTAIGGGFERGIEEGELFALWFYGSSLEKTPPIVWRRGKEMVVARYCANLFTGRPYKRLRAPKQTLAEAAPYIAGSPRLTIFLVTDGSDAVNGTPYDNSINNALQLRRNAFRSADKPMIVTFIAREGKIVHATLHNDPGQPFRITPVDREDVMPAKAVAASSAPGEQDGANAADLEKALAAVRSATPSAQSDLDKAVAAVRAATPAPAESDADKARAALRDALDGKVAHVAPAPALAMQFAPALQPPPPEPANPPTRPATERPAEAVKIEPPVAKEPVAAPVVAPDKNVEPPPATQAVRPKPAEVVVATAAPTPIAPTPITATPEPKRIATEPPKEQPKKVLAKAPEPKPIVREEPKTAAPASAPVAKPHPAEVAAEQKPAAAPASAPVQVAALSPQQKNFPWPALIGGLALIAIGGAVAIARARNRAKSPGSIITQALPRRTDRPPQ